MNSTIKTPAKAARNHPQPSQPARLSAPTSCSRHGGTANENRKNDPITNTVMNVVSLVVNEIARTAPMIAG